MNVLPLVLLAWLCLGLEVGFREALRLGDTAIAPSFVIPLMVWVALAAPPKRASWAAVGLGVLLDLTWIAPLEGGGGRAHVLGPYALGMLVAAQLVIAMRGLVIRRVFITVGLLSALAAVVAHVFIVSIMFVRSRLGDSVGFDPAQQFQLRMWCSMWTGVAGLVLAFGFNQLEPLMGFDDPRRHRFGHR